MNDFIQENRKYCEHEKIEILAHELPNNGIDYKSAVKKSLKKLVKKNKVDVLWVPNDNILLKPDILREVWLPCVKKNKVPLIVGAESLVNPKLNFGTFAVLPDHNALGSQTAELIFEAMENDWKFDEQKIVPPVSIYKIINLKQVEQSCKIKEKNLENVDKILK
jgi:hypothetical protein